MRLNLSRVQQGLLPLVAPISAVFLLLAACSEERTALTASRAWILESFAESAFAGGLTVRNRTNEARVLQHIMVADFRRASIQTKEGAHLGSSPLAPIVIEAYQTMELPPDGMILLLEGPERPFHTGDEVLLALHFDDGQAVFINAEVRASPPLPSGFEP